MQERNKPRKWWLAGLLSLLEPGLGQIYNGQVRKGILFLVLPLALLPVTFFLFNNNRIVLLLVLFSLWITAFYSAAIADAILAARRFKTDYKLKRYNKVITYVGVFVFALTVNTAISEYFKNNCFQAFKIPAGSCAPTLLIGDHVIADMRMSARHPERGALVIFEYPKEPEKDFVKRVVATGGETLEIRDKLLFINNEPFEEAYAVYTDATVFPAELNPRDNFGPITVPENHCFVLGDNRDNSYDSRFWGFVENGKIKGSVKSIYWSWDHGNAAVRWDRIGTIVR